MSAETFTLAPPPWMRDARALRVLHTLAEAGYEARYVGGCVRDALAGRTVTDIDIATTAPPQTAAQLLQAAGIGVVPTGIDHGTVTAIVERKPFEVTTLRRDVETDGRRAKVAFTDRWEEDAARRDFTMNALFASEDGEVTDFFGGRADLAAGLVRFVGEPQARIAEDVLRLLRYFRFHAHYGKGAADEAALLACRSFAHRLSGLSGERVRAETLKLLAAPRAGEVWRLMRDTGIVAHLLPRALDVARLEALIALEAALGRDADPLLRLAALLPPDGAAAVAERLKLSRADSERLAAALAPTPVIGAGLCGAALRSVLYRFGLDRVRDRLLLAAAGEGATAESLAPSLQEAARWKIPSLPVRGADALALGLAPGPGVKALLEAVETWWVAEDFAPDRAACLARLREESTARARRA